MSHIRESAGVTSTYNQRSLLMKVFYQCHRGVVLYCTSRDSAIYSSALYVTTCNAMTMLPHVYVQLKLAGESGCMTSAISAVSLCLSVRPSQAGVLSKRL